MNNKGNTEHGGHGTLTYARWKSMMQRCSDSTHAGFARYGGRGVSVCERWHDFPSFLTDMGECPDVTMTLDRLDNDKGYVPGNCRWAMSIEQCNNKTNNRHITFNGKTQGLRAWAEETGIKATNILNRLYMGWSIERTLTTVKDARAGRKIYRRTT